MIIQKKRTHLLRFSFLSSTLLLMACGGGSGNSDSQPQPEQPTPPLISRFSSTLTLQDKGKTVQAIDSRTTTEGKDTTLAYRVSTHLENNLRITTDSDNRITASFPQISQTFSFQLGNAQNAPVLDILYDTLARKVTDITLRRDRESPQPDTLSCSTQDQINPQTQCQGLTLHYVANSGKFSIAFNNTILTKITDHTPQAHTVTLNGQLTGELSIKPLSFDNIPQTSSGNILVNGKVLKVLATNSSSSSLGRPRTALTALLEDGSGIYFSKYPTGTYESRYILPDPAVLIANPDTTTQLNHQTIAQSDTFQLGTTRFNFDAPFSGETPAPVTISGTLTVLKPRQQFSYAPVVPAGVDASSYWYGTSSPLRYSYLPEGISITLTNHNGLVLENNGLVAIIKNKKVQSISFNNMLMSAESLQFAAYSCGQNGFSCQGAMVTADGYGILFNDTKLGATGQQTVEMPVAITLNGGLVYPGR